MTHISIKNGANGDTAKVDPNLRLHTAGIVEFEKDHAVDTTIAEKYNINTGTITLTNATKTSLLYVKNTGLYDLIITAFIYNLGTSTGGTGEGLIEVVRNPTAGGIVTNANNVSTGTGVEANLNFGASNTLPANIYKGATGETAVSGGDGVSLSTLLSTPAGRIFLDVGKLIVPKGKTLAVDYTPPTSNTSQGAQIALACYYAVPKISESTV
jgi:hypothetical protein